MKEALETRKDKSVPTDFLIDLLDLVLPTNIFEFNSLIKLFLWSICRAMGTRAAATFANIFVQK